VAPEAAAYEFCAQAVQLVAPLLPWYWPAAHDVHETVPLPAAYVPATHVVQLDELLLGPAVPAAHVVQMADAAAAYVPAAQVAHWFALAAPVADKYKPAVHEVQLDEPELG
jgi:hypothetical protein